MNPNLKYRFPGTSTFTHEDSDIFFGRDNQIYTIQTSIIVNPTTVIFGKSGTGKSSLIQAGVKPSFYKNNSSDSGYEFIDIVVKEFKPGKNLLLEVRNKIIDAQSIKSPLSFLESLDNYGLWALLKKRHFDNHKNNVNKTIVLVFDQAEDLFSYPEHQIQSLINEIQPAIRQYIPQEIYKLFEAKVQSGELNTTHKIIAEQPIPVKFVFAIRSDKLHLLTRLKEASPDILVNSVELLPLNKVEVFEVIDKPSQSDNKFLTPKFFVTQEAKEYIFNQLDAQSINNSIYEPKGLIEPFSLQIICSSIERKIVENDHDKIIEKSELPDLEEVILDFYVNALAKLSTENGIRESVSKYIEENMLNSIDKRRISIDESLLIRSIQQDSIEKLLYLRIFKRDISSSGGTLYELSHDCFVIPILKARDKRLGTTNSSEKTIENLLHQINLLKDGDSSNTNQTLHNIPLKSEEGQIKQGLSELSNVSVDHGKLISLYSEIGHAYKTIKRYDAALNAFKETLKFKDCEPTTRNNILITIADIYFELNDYGNLDAYFDLLYQNNIEDYKIVSEIAFSYALYANKKAIPELTSMADKFETLAIELSPNQAVVFTDIGNFHFKLGSFDKAIGYYQKTLTINPLADYAQFNIGLCEERKGNIQTAIENFKFTLNINVGFSKAYYELGRCYFSLKNYKEALEYFDKTIALDPNAADAYHSKAMVFEAIQDFEKAKQNYYLTIEKNPSASYAYYNLGRISFNNNDFEDAKKKFQRAIELNPSDYEAYNEMGRCFHATEHWKQALDYFIKCFQLNPHAEYAIYNAGLVELKLGMKESAKNYFKEALKINPNYENALYEYAHILISEGSFDESRNYFKKLLEVNPAFSLAYNEIGRCYASENNFDEAIPYYLKFIEINPNVDYAFYNVALAENGRGNKEVANSYFLKTIEINPNYVNAYYDLAFNFSEAEKFDDAIKYYLQATEIKPDYADAFNNLADCYLKAGKIELAKKSIDKAIALNSSNYIYNQTLLEIVTAMNQS